MSLQAEGCPAALVSPRASLEQHSALPWPVSIATVQP